MVKPGRQVNGVVNLQAVLTIPPMEEGVDPDLLDRVLDAVRHAPGNSFLDVCEGVWYAAAYSLHAQIDPGMWGP